MTTATPNLNAQYFNDLVNQLWNGELSENDFLSEGALLGIDPARLQSVLDFIRATDGLLTAVEG